MEGPDLSQRMGVNPRKLLPVSTANLDAMSLYFGRGQCLSKYSRLTLNS